MTDSTFSVGKENEGSSDSELALSDGSVFTVGGTHSSLALLAKKDKISNKSKVFSVGISVADETKKEEGEKYSISSELARGGMGSILEARDNDLRRTIAMKVMLSGENPPPPEYERFIKEAQVTGFLEHPNIVPVHELGVDKNDRPFFVMKLVGGESLQSILERIRKGNKGYIEKYPFRNLLGIFIQVCNAVSYAHSKGVIHRDLKPENIMVGEFGEVLVMDWGLSKVMDLEEIQVQRDFPRDNDYTKTIEGSVIGTPAYMPPEQAKGDAELTDERSDVFSLGAILCEMVTGKPIYSGNSIMEVIAKASSVEIEKPSPKTKLPKELMRICFKALAKEMGRRYSSVQELSDAIRSYLDNRVIPEYRLKPWQKLLQSLCIGGLFTVLVPIINMSFASFLNYIYVPAVLAVVGYGLSYQIMVYGGKLSLFGRLLKQNRSVAQTAGTLKLQEGFLLGSLLAVVLGMLTVMTFIEDPSHIGSGMSLALNGVLYIYPLFLILRLDYIREARQNALFGVIAPNRLPNLVQMSFLFAVPTGMNMWVLYFSGGITSEISAISLQYLSSNSLYIFAVSFVFAIIYFRIIFKFKELWAAVGHIFTFLAGGHVAEENKIHASSVIRFSMETFFLWILSSCVIFNINLLATVEEKSGLLNYLALVCTVSTFALLFYILINFVLIRKFAGDGGFNKSNDRLTKSVYQFYQQQYGSYWSSKKRGIVLAILSTLSTILFGFVIMILIGVSLTRFFVLIILALVLLASYQRRKYRKMFEIFNKNDTRTNRQGDVS